MSKRPNIAFIATDNDNTQHIFYAENEHGAGHVAMLSLKLDQRGLRIKRGPMFDKYEHKPIPPQLAIDWGFTLDCTFCEKPLSKGNSYTVTANDIYCSVHCKDGLAEIIRRFNL